MVTPSPRLIATVMVLVAMAAGAVSLTGLPLRRAMVTAAARGTIQLAVVSTLLAVVLDSLRWTVVYIVGMFVVATVTSARRLGTRPWTAVPIAAGALPVLCVVLGSGTVPWQPQSVLPIAGILIGGGMTVTSLAAQRMFDELTRRAGEYEAALALGMPARNAALLVARDSAGLALVPALDQTRTVGLVTLPGAFVGVLLGGGSPAAAGAAQLLVLVGLLAAQSVAVLLATELVARRYLITTALARRLPL